MALTRRGMLGAIGGAVAGGRSAIGKVVATAPVAPMTGPMYGSGGHVEWVKTSESSSMSILDIQRRLGYWPEWWLDEQRRFAKGDVRHCGIDMDIDALKSVSRVGKFQMQAERNFQNRIASPERRDLANKARNAVLQSLGIDWISDE